MHDIPQDRQFLFDAAIGRYQELEARLQASLAKLIADTCTEMGLDATLKWSIVRSPKGWALQEPEGQKEPPAED